jgi:hypothetical protein
MKRSSSISLLLFAVTALTTITSQIPSFAANNAQTSAATVSLTESSGAVNSQVKQDNSAGEASDERLTTQGAEEAPISPQERQAILQKSAPNLGENALRVAIGELNTKESGSNCQKYSRYFGKTCQVWCADFVSWAFDVSSNGNKKVPWGNPSAVSSIISWGQKGYQVKTPRPGDIFTLKGPDVSHTGLVRRVEGKYFYTVEGNTSDSVKSLKRSLNTNNLKFFRYDRYRSAQ